MTSFPGKRKLSRMSIADIRAFACETELDDAFLDLLKSDKRSGVRALARTLENRRRKREAALERQKKLRVLEDSLRSRGKTLIAGVDEAGRGPLAGPVVAAAVILPEDLDLPGLNDSKKLTPHRREELFGRICGGAVAWGIGIVDNEEINASNVLGAAMKAMRAAFENMRVKPDAALVDGNRSPGLSCDERLVIDGDAQCRSIAAASIVAKVTRDRLMKELDGVFPGYGFSGHKGYGSREHINAIMKNGPCDIHRLSFRIVLKSSPRGTAVRILEKRLRNASSRDALESTAACISGLKDMLDKSDVERLRGVYRQVVSDRFR